MPKISAKESITCLYLRMAMPKIPAKESITCFYLRMAMPEISAKESITCLYLRNIKSEMRSFKSNENIHKKEGGSYYVVSANKASSVTL